MLRQEFTDTIDLEMDLDDCYLDKLRKLGKPHRFGRNEQLYRQGESAEHIYVLESGSVKSTCTDESGNETLLNIHGPGNLLGLSALRPQAKRDANGVALEEVVASAFSSMEFCEHIRQDGELGIILVQVLLKRQQKLHTRVSDVVGLSVEQRLARAILQLHAEIMTRVSSSAEIVIPMTHEELANLVLSRRQYITAILRRFVAANLIKNKRGQIVVLDQFGLGQLLH